MNQIERISHFEKILNKGEDITKKLNSLLDEFHDFQKEIDELDEYYQSEERALDLRADENHELPEDLPRGVLGEDYVYDLLTTWDELKKILKDY